MTNTIDDIIYNLEDLNLEDEEEEEENPLTIQMPENPNDSLYLHIDLREMNRRHSVCRRINTYMIRNGYYDPRKASGFSYNLLDEYEDLEQFTDTAIRRMAGITSNSYYEFWCIDQDFDIVDMLQYLEQNTGQDHFQIHLYFVVDNEIQRIKVNIH